MDRYSFDLYVEEPSANASVTAERLRIVIESIPSGLLLVNARGEIVLVNRQAEIMFGHSREALIGKKMEILLPERYRKNHPNLQHAFMEQPSSRSMGTGRDLFALRADGNEFPVEVGLNPVKSEEGIYVVATIVDVVA
ncbi:MAG: PAS domain S-box protein, partial [Verrucomicrobiota bacterium]